MRQRGISHTQYSTNEEERVKVSVGTAALLEYFLQQEQPQEQEYTFCLGADAFLDLTAGKWKESERVLQLLQGRFLVLQRIGIQQNNNDTTTIDTALEKRVQSIPGARLVSLPSLGDVSSSRVREAVAKEDSTDTISLFLASCRRIFATAEVM